MATQPPGWTELLGMGAVIATLLVVGLALGWLVDTLLNTVPIFILVGLVLGMAGAASYLHVTFRKYLQS
jgi:F0F1-type ATP synthase assembly protein I